ncbi:MAG: hypothetical protein KDA65_06070 [Planctomycetaceae bacterium]|nr:hypothetical protein [Planctomycetaceae bacterium]
MHRVLLFSVCSLLLVLSGCGDSEITQLNPTNSTEDLENPFGHSGVGVETSDPYVNIDRSRKSFEGKWILTSTNSSPKEQYTIDQDWALVEISKDASGSYQGKISQTTNLSEGAEPPHLENLKIEENGINFDIHLGDRIIPCEGKLSEGLVLGSLFSASRMVLPLRMGATNATSLSTDSKDRNRQTPLTSDFMDALKTESPQKSLLEFVEKHPENPYALRAILLIYSMIPNKDFDAEYLDQVGEKSIELTSKYGDRMLMYYLQNFNLSLIETHQHPELAEKYLQKFEEKMTEDERKMMTATLDNARVILNIDRAILSLEENPTSEAVEQLKTLNKQNPFDERILLVLGDYALAQDQQDDAINYFGQLATVPFLQKKVLQRWKRKELEKTPPAVTFKELWEKKHGDLSGIEEYKDQILKNLVTNFPVESGEKKEVEGNRRKILCEFFTSAPCEPCVVPDLALETISKAYHDDELIILGYHTHSGGPDPMANPHSLARHESLRPQTEDNRTASPMVTLNGKLSPLRGVLIEGFSLWQSLFTQELEPLRNTSSRIKINLSAHAENKQLNIKASTEGLVPPLTNFRLRLALVEEHVDYISTNGLRSYSMVVRNMPSGPEGVEATGDSFAFDKKFDLAEMKEGLLNYVDAFEDQANYKFPAKPLHMKKMFLVGFVQNDETREILQAEIVPVTGDLDYGIMDEITRSATTSAEPSAATETDAQPESEPKKTEESQPTEAKPAPEKPEATPGEAEKPQPEPPAESSAEETPATENSEPAQEPPKPAEPTESEEPASEGSN